MAEDLCMVAVLDGYGSGGWFYSFMVSRRLVDICRKRANKLASKPDARTLLMESAAFGPEVCASPCGGTAATVALVLKGGRFSIASIGDSAVYVLERNSVRRLFDYNRIVELNGISRMPVVVRIGKSDLPLPEYLDSRRILIGSINARGIDASALEIEEGRLKPGMKLLLASDGMTKNLYFSADVNMNVRDVSGSEDLAGLLPDGTGVGHATARVLSEIKSRVARGDKIVAQSGNSNQVLIPCDDDMTITMLSFGCQFQI